jgi:hypothetical protein
MSAATQPTFVFDAERHIYTLDGRVLPSVTQILEATGLVDFSRVSEGVLSAAQWRGSAVHHACHLDDEGDLDESTVEPEHHGYLSAWRKFKAESGFVPEVIEQPAYSIAYGYAGIPDRIGAFRPAPLPAIVDLKTGAIQPSVRWQLAAYAHLHSILPHRPGVFKRIAVRLMPSGAYVVKFFSRADLARDFLVFASALNVWRAKEENL